MTHRTPTCIFVLMLALMAVPAHAEVGDYTPLRSFLNLFFPPQADNPVDDALRDRLPMPLIENPEGFDDGFNPQLFQLWQTVSLDESTGAICGDGSPFEFYVNRSHTSSNLVVFFEAGGACWSQETCDGAQLSTGGIGAPLPDPLSPLITLASIATSRSVAGFTPKSQDWSFVYVPYCGQDVHAGDAVRVYDDVDPTAPQVVQHRGRQIHAAVITWLKSRLEQPGQTLVTGQSAGGFGAQALYHPYRIAMDTERGYLLNDAGTVMPAPLDEDRDEYPSIWLHETGAFKWALSPYLDWFEVESVHFDRNDLSTSADAISALYPDDRHGLATSQEDHTIAGFSYNLFFEEIYDEPELDLRDAFRNALRFQDTPRLRASLDPLPNFGYFAPGFRDLLGGHVLTLPFVEGAQIEKQNGAEVHVFEFLNDVLSGTGPVMKEWEDSVEDDYLRYDDFVNVFYRLFLSEGDGDIFLGGGIL